MVPMVANKPKTVATKILLLPRTTSFFFKINQALTPATNKEATIYEEITVCKNLFTATGFIRTAQKSTISFRIVSGLNSIPTGCCIQPFATKIHNAERLEPIATNQLESR